MSNLPLWLAIMWHNYYPLGSDHLGFFFLIMLHCQTVAYLMKDVMQTLFNEALDIFCILLPSSLATLQSFNILIDLTDTVWKIFSSWLGVDPTRSQYISEGNNSLMYRNKFFFCGVNSVSVLFVPFRDHDFLLAVSFTNYSPQQLISLILHPTNPLYLFSWQAFDANRAIVCKDFLDISSFLVFGAIHRLLVFVYHLQIVPKFPPLWKWSVFYDCQMYLFMAKNIDITKCKLGMLTYCCPTKKYTI